MPRAARWFTRRALLLCSLLVAMFATTAATSRATKDASALRHTRLLRSIPLADSAITASPATVQLWFSEKIELGLSRVRIEDAAGKSVAVSPLTQDATRTGAPVVGRVPAPLANGTYKLHWTAASADGHAVKGSFGFTIRSH